MLGKSVYTASRVLKSYLVLALVLSFMAVSVSQTAHAAQTICNDNGGSGWPINDGSNTTIQIDYNFGDVGYLLDIDVDVDITHTWMGDLTASVTSPNGGGTNVVLFSRPGTTQGATVNAGPYGCPGNDLDVLFDDEAVAGPIENATCGNNPAYSGSHQPHDVAPNNLSAFDGENPTGVWDFNFFDPIDLDTGSMNEACLVISAAAVTFDQWVSTNPTCSDQVDALSEYTGTNLYVCYTLANPGDEAFTLSAGDWNDSLGNDLSSLEGNYNAGDSQTVNFGPFPAGSSPFFVGTTIATADVTIRGNSPPNFPNTETIFTDETINVNVSNVLPGAAAKPLYLYNDLSLSRVIPTTAQNEINFGEGVTRTWTMTPALESDLDINFATPISLSLYMRELGTGNQRNITFTVAGSVSGTLATHTQTFALTGASTLYNVNMVYSGGAPATLVDGETITLTVTNNTTGSGNRRVRIIPANPVANRSVVFLPTSTIINVDVMNVYDVDYATDPAAAPITNAQAGDTVYIRAQVSDPFGTFDITALNNQISDPTPTVQATNIATTTVVDNVADAQKLYEFAYTIPPFPVLGDWRIDVTAVEGAASEGITHSNFIDLLVMAPPSLAVVKTATTTNPGTADPGETITYTITVSNSGLGFAENIVLDDTPSQFTDINTGSFSCSAGCPSSGVTMGTPTFTTGSDGDIINWNLIMGGSLTGGQSFSIEYTADVE